MRALFSGIQHENRDCSERRGESISWKSVLGNSIPLMAAIREPRGSYDRPIERTALKHCFSPR